MVINDISASVNALVCTGIVITLMLYRRRNAQHRTGMSLLAWLITVAYSAVPLAYLCGIYPDSSWLTVAANVFILTALISVRGNIARLIDLLRQ